MVNRLRIISLMAFGAILSCSLPQKMEVSQDQYARQVDCWNNGKGEFSAFIVFEPVGNYYYAHIVSAKCYVKIDGLDYKTATAVSKGPDLLDSRGYLTEIGSISNPILPRGSYYSRLPLDSRDVYFIVAPYNSKISDKRLVIDLMGLRYLKYTGKEFGDILKLNDVEKLRVARSFDASL